jgi:hypothetical protein
MVKTKNKIFFCKYILPVLDKLILIAHDSEEIFGKCISIKDVDFIKIDKTKIKLTD